MPKTFGDSKDNLDTTWAVFRNFTLVPKDHLAFVTFSRLLVICSSIKTSKQFIPVKLISFLNIWWKK